MIHGLNPSCTEASSASNSSGDRTSFNIREHIEKLTPAKGENRYICPVCAGNNLTIDPESGKYQCWSGCKCRDIREAISPSKQGKQPKTSKPKPLTPAPIPLGSHELAKLPTPIEIPQKRKRGNRTEIEYPYSDTQWVLRVETPSQENPKGYEKATYPYHLNTDGEPLKGKGEAAWDAYRIDEVQAHAPGKWALGVEGESCVEAARFLEITSFSLMGSAWSEGDSTRLVLMLKSAGVAGIAYFPDHDETGYKKAQVIADAAAKVQLPFILLDPTLIWAECPHKGDIADWVKWGMEQGWEKEEFIRQLEKQFSSAVERAILRQDDDITDEEQAALDDWADTFSANPDVVFNQKLLNFLYGDKPWICVDGKLYSWTGTHYEYSPDSVERRKITSFCNTFVVANAQGDITYPYANTASVNEGLRWVKYNHEIDSRLLNPPGLNCTNGVLEIRWDVISSNPMPQWELVPHDPNQYFTYEPLVKYDPEANTEACDRLLEALEAPQRDIFLKTIGASFDLTTIRKYKGRMVRALLLKGHGSNGKDTLREAVSAMYGHQGMTNKTLADFAAYDEGRKFPLAPLKYSRVNWASENANTTRLDKIQSLKAFITGDPLDSERKGQDEDPFKPKGVALFNCNDTPNLRGTLEAIAGRYGVLAFNKTFKIGANRSKGELEADPRFKDDPEFLKSEVLPAFLNRVLDALTRLMTEGIDYSCTEDALESIQIENSHLFQFCKDTGLKVDPEGMVTAGELWTILEQWYIDNGTLTYEETSTGKRKSIWIDQARKGDANVKGANQIVARFQALFPPVKRVTIGKGKMALQGLSFASPPPNGEPVCPNGEPVVSQLVSQKPLIYKDGEPVTPVSHPARQENEKPIDESDFIAENQNQGQDLPRLAHHVDTASVSASPTAPVTGSPAPITGSPAIETGIPLSTAQAQKSIPVGWWVRIPSLENELAQVKSYYPTGACVEGLRGAYGVYSSVVALSEDEMLRQGLRWL